MVRRRWPDVLIVVALVAITTVGIWAIWGEAILGSDHDPAIERVEGGGVT